MKKEHAYSILALVVLLGMLAAGGIALAQTSANYNLEWHVIGGGGQPVTSASYAINSTVGQGAASPPYSASSSYVVSGGYWLSGGLRVYLPLVMREYP